MTREDAIDVLKHNYPSACFTDLCDAVELAIKALSEPEIIRCKDCIHEDDCLRMIGERAANVWHGIDYCSRGERINNETD